MEGIENKKQMFISEIATFTTIEQTQSAMERVKEFPISEWDELMEEIKKSTKRILLKMVEDQKNKLNKL